MATPFRLKRSAIEGKRPADSDLQRGELALNTYDGYLYTEREGVGLSTVTNLTPWYENYGGGSIYYSNSVGIGTTVPQYNLDVRKGSIGGYDTLVAQHSDVVKEIAVTVASKTNDHRYQGQGSGNGYVLDGIQAPVLTLTPGRTYKFNLSSSDMSSHPFRFYLDEAKSVQYTTNVTTTATSSQITITDDTPNILHYQCSSHGYMGNALIINSNVINTPYAAIIRNGLDVLSGNVDISSNLNVTGNLDVDGNTTLDATTIDGLLDINAGGQANTFKVEDLTSGRVVIAGTGGELEDSGNLLFNGTDLSAASLIVSDLTDNRVLIAGSSGAVEDSANLTFNGSLLNVTGGAAVDNVQIGVTGNNEIDTSSGDLTIDSAGGTTTIDDILTVTGQGTFNGNVSIGGTLTVTGDVGIAGTLTYEDVSRVDAVGLSTFREGIFLPDNQKAQFGNAAGSADLNIYHTGTQSIITNSTGTFVIQNTSSSGTLALKVYSNNRALIARPEGATELYFDDSKKIETTAKGIQVGTGVTIETNGQATFTGVVTATKFVGDGSDLIGIDASALKFGGVVKAQANGFGVVVTGVTTSTGGFSGNLTGTATLATDLAINGTNQLLYQDSNNDTAILPTGSAGQILQSNGAGAEPQWVTSAPAGAIEGITIRDESSIVGTANSISTINFVGSNVTADAAALAGISTIQIDHMTVQDEGSVVGTAGSISTLNFVGAGIAAAVSGSTATITAAGGVTNADVVALAIALG
tara:strand:- start:74 stop:2326 length:2253 start_codon:yes stop_codon:yes gene_type:complete